MFDFSWVQSFGYAFLIGFIPALIWLGFWLLQDLKRPEPRLLLLKTFGAGMLCVLLVLPIQKFAATYFALGFPLLLIWAAAEELLKFGAAWLVALRNRAVDEPIDVPIYFITVALGFAALENMLFLLTPLAQGQFEHGLITGNLRFLGATLIHVLSSAVIAGALAFAFYKRKSIQILYGTVGVILAILLHAVFNFSIINTRADLLLTIFAAVWVGIVFLLLILERVKSISRPAWWKKIFLRK
ncbi:MAG: PrsW family intramembrane metalloprotease [Patescibacteria group bacterium UBA2163]